MAETQEKLEGELDEVSLADKRVDIQTFDRYKGRKGVTDRLAIISTTLARARTHFFEGPKKKTSFKCLSTPQKQAVCCKQTGEPDQKFGLVLFHYTTDASGDLVSEDKLTGKVKLWVISESRYSELSQIHKQFPLLDLGKWDAPQHDLMAKCTEENWQRFTFTPTSNAFWKSKQAWYDTLKLKEAKAKARLSKAIGQDLTEIEIMSLLEVDAGNTVAPTAADGEINVSDVLDE